MLYKIVLCVEFVLECRTYDSHCISGTRMGCFGSTGLYIPFGPGLDRRGCSLRSTVVRRGPGLDPVSYHHLIITGSSLDHQATPRIISVGQETLVRREGETVGKRE